MASEYKTSGSFSRTAGQCFKPSKEESTSQQIQELIEANTNWQKYNSERDAYVKRLLEEAADRDAKISDLQTQVTAANKKFQISEESRKQLEKDKAELATQLRNTMEKLQELSNRSTEASSSSELLILREEQVKAYKEDFESERRDRERAQSRLADVEMELEIVKRELRQYNQREMQDLHQRRQASLEYHRQEYLKKNPQSVYQMDHFDDRNPEDGEDEIDGC